MPLAWSRGMLLGMLLGMVLGMRLGMSLKAPLGILEEAF